MVSGDVPPSTMAHAQEFPLAWGELEKKFLPGWSGKQGRREGWLSLGQPDLISQQLFPWEPATTIHTLWNAGREGGEHGQGSVGSGAALIPTPPGRSCWSTLVCRDPETWRSHCTSHRAFSKSLAGVCICAATQDGVCPWGVVGGAKAPRPAVR